MCLLLFSCCCFPAPSSSFVPSPVSCGEQHALQRQHVGVCVCVVCGCGCVCVRVSVCDEARREVNYQHAGPLLAQQEPYLNKLHYRASVCVCVCVCVYICECVCA